MSQPRALIFNIKGAIDHSCFLIIAVDQNQKICTYNYLQYYKL